MNSVFPVFALIGLIALCLALLAFYIRRARNESYNAFKRRHGFLGLALAAGVAACVTPGCATADQDYVEADRANYRDIGPKYLGYVEADPTLSEDQKQAERDSVELWRLRGDAAAP